MSRCQDRIQREFDEQSWLGKMFLWPRSLESQPMSVQGKLGEWKNEISEETDVRCISRPSMNITLHRSYMQC